MKRYFVKALLQFSLALGVLFLLSGCGNTISLYDQYAYTQATSIKVDALNVMDLATDSYDSHVKEINDLNVEIQKIYEYDKNRPKNKITTTQWEILIDPNGKLLGGFFAKWKRESKESSVYMTEKKKEISLAFDQIIQLEIAKNKSGK